MTGFRLAMDDDREARAAEAARQAEEARIAAEKAAADAAKQAEQERIAAEKKTEQDRIAAEKAAEQERIAAEKAASDAAKKAEQERIAAEKAAEQQRIAAEKAAEQQRVAAEKKARQEEQQRKAQHRRDSLRALPWQTFFTVNAACSGLPQLSYGFKVGQVKVAGWYFSAMTNFHFKGAFTPFEEGSYVLTGKQNTTRLSATAGLVALPCKLVSLHIGAGFGYRSLNIETESGWRSMPRRTAYGPEVALGLMFHIKGFVISAEGVYTYDLNGSDLKWSSGLEGKLGIGFCLPNKR